jgi:hypothetical protein
MDLRLEDKVILVTGGDGGYVHLLRPDLAVHDRNIRARRSDGHLPRARFLRTPPGGSVTKGLRILRSVSILLLRGRFALRKACQSTWLPAALNCMPANVADRRD